MMNFILDLFAQRLVNVLILSRYLVQHLKINNYSCDNIVLAWDSGNMMSCQMCHNSGVLEPLVHFCHL